VIGLIQPEILRNSGLFVTAALEILSTEPKAPLLPLRKEMFYWRYETIVNHEMPPVEDVIKGHQDVQDPDVDCQLSVVADGGSTGEAARTVLIKNLWTANEKLAQSKGLAVLGRAQTGGGMMGARGPSKTTVVLGMKGLAPIRDDLRWADVLAKQGLGFVLIDRPADLFDAAGLSGEGKSALQALGKTSLLVIVKGLDSAQAKALLENSSKPVFLQTTALYDEAVLGLVKKTRSAVGLVLGKDESAESYIGRILAAKKSLGSEYLSIVTENCLWSAAGKDQMIGVISELLKAKLELTDLANLFSGSFTGLLNPAGR